MNKITLTTLFALSALMGTAHASTETIFKKAACTKLETLKSWGMETAINLQNCDATLIRDAASIKAYIKKICQLINVEQKQATLLTHRDSPSNKSGYSVAQLVERGSISGHFDNHTNNAYIRIFTSSPHEATAVAAFSTTFFKAHSNKTTTSSVA